MPHSLNWEHQPLSLLKQLVANKTGECFVFSSQPSSHPWKQPISLRVGTQITLMGLSWEVGSSLRCASEFAQAAGGGGRQPVFAHLCFGLQLGGFVAGLQEANSLCL